MAVDEYNGLLSRPSRVLSWYRGLTSVTVFTAFALVVLGGVVRVTGSGLGCPDWPLCNGSVIPPLETKAIIEYSHRIVASLLVGPMVLATVAMAWIAFRKERWVVIPATVALLLLLGQAILGGVTVERELPGGIVTAHLALGEALLACLVLIAVVSYRGPLRLSLIARIEADGRRDIFPFLALVAAVGIYGLLISGSIVTATGSTAGCLDWPLCQGEFFPDQREAGIHMGHRLLTVIIGLIVIFALRKGIMERHRPHRIRHMSMVVIGLFAAQVLVGAGTVWLEFSTEFRALHLAAASAVWVSIFLLFLSSLNLRVDPVSTPEIVTSEELARA